MSVNRLDLLSVETPKWDSTPQGGLKARAYLTRTGVLTYHYPDPTNPGGLRTVRELRHPDEVFHPDSLATLEGSPVVVGHPAMVDTDNWQGVAVGHVGDSVAPEGGYVSAHIRVQDKKAVDSVRDGSLVELSCGYTCDVAEESGVFQGETYDAVQKNIRYNHVGMGPRGWGRAGSEVRLRADSHYSICNMSIEHTDSDLQARHDALTGKYDAEKARADALELQVATLTEQLGVANSAERIDGLVLARVTLLDSARAVMGTAEDFKGKTDREVMVAAITHVDSAFKSDGKNDAYIQGRFDSTVEQAKKDALGRANKSTTDAAQTSEADAIEAARQRNLQKSNTAWQTKPAK